MKRPDINNYFGDEDLTVILEAARTALCDAEIFDELADRMDIDDSELKRVQENLERYMGDV
jgi:hypothetical protein